MRLLLEAVYTIEMHNVNREQHINLSQVQSILDNGKVASAMDTENKFGLTELSTLESGEIIEPMVKESLFMLMAIFMKVSGPMIRQMAQGHTLT